MTTLQIDDSEIISTVYRDGKWYVGIQHEGINYNIMITALVGITDADLSNLVYNKLLDIEVKLARILDVPPIVERVKKPLLIGKSPKLLASS